MEAVNPLAPPKEKGITELLSDLDDANCRMDTVNLSQKDAEKSIMTAEILAELENIREEFAVPKESIQAKIDEIREKIKGLMMYQSKTIKGEFYQAVYVKPKRKWNMDKVEGLFDSDPNLNVDDYSELGTSGSQIRKV